MKLKLRKLNESFRRLKQKSYFEIQVGTCCMTVDCRGNRWGKHVMEQFPNIKGIEHLQGNSGIPTVCRATVIRSKQKEMGLEKHFCQVL